MDRRNSADKSRAAPIRTGSGQAWQDALASEKDDQENRSADTSERNSRRQLLAQAMGCLNERERHILAERRLKDEPMRLADLAQIYGISRERVRKIEARAFEKVQQAMAANPTAPYNARRRKWQELVKLTEELADEELDLPTSRPRAAAWEAVKSFSARLHDWLKLLRFTHQTGAVALGVPRRTLQNWLQGRKCPHERLVELAMWALEQPNLPQRLRIAQPSQDLAERGADEIAQAPSAQ